MREKAKSIIQSFTWPNSSTVARASFAPRSGLMRIWFTSGKSYIYAGVSIECWEKFATAPSKGKYVAESIRPRYEGIPMERFK